MQRIDIELKPSRIFLSLIGLVVVGSLGIAASLSIAWVFKIVIIISVLGYGTWILWVVGLMKGADSIVGLQLLSDGSYNLRYPLCIIEAEMKGDSTVTNAVCVLRFRVPGKRLKVSCVVFKDSVDRELYRKLLVWLRCFGAEKQVS